MVETVDSKPKPAHILEASVSLPPRHRAAVTFAIILGLFLAAIEQTVVATAMPTVVASLGGLQIYSWVFSAYLLAFTVSVPLWGRLSDMYGRRAYYIASVGLFLLGSILAGQSRSMAFLIVSRAIQGLGAGGVFPIGFTIVGEIYSLERRARIQGLFSGVWGVASIVGPLAGGLITDYLSWRWVFYVNVPFGLAACVLIHRYLVDPPRTGRRGGLDVSGAALLATAATALLLGLIEMGQRGDATHEAAVGFVGLAAVLFVAFVLWERRAEEPVLPLSLFSNPVFRVASGVGLLAGMGLFGSVSFIPLFVQGVLLGSATRAGSALTPLMLAWVTMSVVSSRLILKVGYRPVVVAGMALFTTGFAWLHRLGAGATYAALLPPLAVLGAGMGLSMVAILLAVQNSVPRRFMATAISTNMFFRTIGGAVGVALMGSVMAHRMVRRLADAADPALVELARSPDALVHESARRNLPPEAVEWLRAALGAGLEGVFLTGVVIAGLAFAIALSWFPRGSPEALAKLAEEETPSGARGRDGTAAGER